MKRFVASILSLLMVVCLVLSSCSQKEGTATTKDGTATSKNETAPEAKKEPAEKVKINFWHSLGSVGGQALKDLVKEYNDSQQEVEVIETFQGGYPDTAAKIMTSVAAGNPPAVAMIERGFVTSFAPDGVLEDLQKYVDKDKFKIDDFFEGLMEFSYFDKKLLSLPLNRSTPLMYYNKTKFEKMGFNPKGPQTWKDLVSYSKALSGDGKYGFASPIAPWYLIEVYMSTSGERTLNKDYTGIGFSRDTGIAALEQWRGMIKEGTMKVPSVETTNEALRSDFANEKIFMIFDSTSVVSSLVKLTEGKFELGAAFIPSNKKFGTPTGGANMSMLAAASQKEKDAGWKFMKWLKQPQQDMKFAIATGYMVTLKSVNQLKEMQDFYIKYPQFKVAVDQLQYAEDSTKHPKWPEVQKILQSNLDKAIRDIDKTNVPQIIDDIDNEVKKLLAKK